MSWWPEHGNEFIPIWPHGEQRAHSGVYSEPPHPLLGPFSALGDREPSWVGGRVWVHVGGSHISWAVFRAWVPHEGTWSKRRSGHGTELGAHGPRTMGEAAKGPAGVAGFLKEKNQNELLRGRLAPDIPLPSGQISV